MNVEQLAYAIPGGMVAIGGTWFIADVVIDGVRSWRMDRAVRRTSIVEGAAGVRPLAAVAPSTTIAEPVAISVYDWSVEPGERPLLGAYDSMAGGTDEEAAVADIERRFAAIVRGESARIHPSNGGAA